MAKFDGMDPKLVRELLAEVRHAAVQLRQIEGRVTQLAGGAGLAIQTNHRPGQVADSCDDMVRDVTARLSLLEKREQPVGTPTSGGDSTTPPDTKPEATKPADTKPEATKPAEDKPEATKPADDKPEATKPAEDKPEASKPADDKPDTVKSGEDKPEATKPADDGKPAQDKPDATPETGNAKDSGDTKDDAPARQDTPAKDHPDDQADPGRPQVVEVDGVKVLQIPVDPPTAKEIEDLLANMDQAEPVVIPAQEQGQTYPAGSGDVQQWANDGSDVVSVEADRLTEAEVKELIENSSSIPPMEMPGVEVPKGEWGKGEWAPENIKPDGEPGSVAPGGPVTATSGGDQADGLAVTTTAGEGKLAPAGVGSPVQVLPIGAGDQAAGDVQQWAGDGSDVVSVEADRLTAAEVKELIENSSSIPPMEMPSVEVPKGEWGKGEWTPENIKPDGAPGSVEPGGPA